MNLFVKKLPKREEKVEIFFSIQNRLWSFYKIKVNVTVITLPIFKMTNTFLWISIWQKIAFEKIEHHFVQKSKISHILHLTDLSNTYSIVKDLKYLLLHSFIWYKSYMEEIFLFCSLIRRFCIFYWIIGFYHKTFGFKFKTSDLKTLNKTEEI